jgi:hypothetical protein
LTFYGCEACKKGGRRKEVSAEPLAILLDDVELVAYPEREIILVGSDEGVDGDGKSDAWEGLPGHCSSLFLVFCVREADSRYIIGGEGSSWGIGGDPAMLSKLSRMD